MTAGTMIDAAATGVRPRTGPVHGDVGVIAVVPEVWGGMWLSRQQILTRLSDWFHIVWVDPPVGWRRLWFGDRARAVGQDDASPPPERGFVVQRQTALEPKFYRPEFLSRWTESRRLQRARRELVERGCKKIVLYIWQPKFAQALELVDHDVSCYHIADEYSFSDVEAPLTVRERQLIERVDQVIVHSPALREKKGHINANTAFITNGVDYDAFAEPREEPLDLRAIAHPRIGYIGRIKVQLDWELLARLTERRPDWSFVFVGPMGFLGDSEGLQRQVFARDNVHYLGPRTVGEIPAYTQHMDVCMLSYIVNNYTRYIFPLKLHEYLAAGRPVVGSDIRSLHEFRDVVEIASDTSEWESKLEALAAPEARSEERREARKSVAREYDWDRLVVGIAGTLCERLERPLDAIRAE